MSADRAPGSKSTSEARRLVERLEANWLAPYPPERLATLRLLVGAFLIWYLLRRGRVFAGLSPLPASEFAPIGVAGVLSQPLDSGTVLALYVLALVGAVAFTLGVAFRVVGPLTVALVLWLTTYRSSWGMIFHSDNLLVWQVAILGTTAAAGAFALRRGGPEPAHARFGWPLRLLLLVTTLAYALAGIAKLRGSGAFWLSGDALLHHVAFNAVRKAELGSNASPITAWVLAHSWIFAPMAWGTLLLELGGPLLLCHRRAAQIWAVGMFAFHWAIELVMSIAFWFPLSFVPFAGFFAVERPFLLLRERLRRRAHGRVQDARAPEPRPNAEV